MVYVSTYLRLRDLQRRDSARPSVYCINTCGGWTNRRCNRTLVTHHGTGTFASFAASSARCTRKPTRIAAHASPPHPPPSHPTVPSVQRICDRAAAGGSTETVTNASSGVDTNSNAATTRCAPEVAHDFIQRASGWEVYPTPACSRMARSRPFRQCLRSTRS